MPAVKVVRGAAVVVVAAVAAAVVLVGGAATAVVAAAITVASALCVFAQHGSKRLAFTEYPKPL